MKPKAAKDATQTGRVTIYRIAQEAGVSAATVSRVLTGNAKVAEAKRRNIAEAIARHNYRPNAAARSLKRQNSRVVGFILPDISHPFYGSAFLGAENQAVERGYSLLLGNTLNDRVGHVTHVESRLLEIMLEKQVDGIVMMGGRVNETRVIPEHRDQLKHILASVPLVTACGRIRGVECWSVEIDEAHGIGLAVNYLAALGHRDIGFLGGVAGIEPTDTRWSCFRAALEDHGLAVRAPWCVESGFGIEDGKSAMEAVLPMRGRPTALLCFNDLVAIGALYAARKSGLRIPEDMSIVGIDNIALSEFVFPGLTSVNLDAVRCGATAVNLIADVLEGRQPNRRVMLQPDLIIRDSCRRLQESRTGQARPR